MAYLGLVRLHLRAPAAEKRPFGCLLPRFAAKLLSLADQNVGDGVVLRFSS